MKIRLRNSEDQPLVVNLKQADYSYLASGENYFLAPGSVPRSNAEWIELATDRIEIAPHYTAEVYYVVRVPKEAPEHEGSYWSLIMIEPESSHCIQDEMALIQVKVRYAYQIVTNVGGGDAKLRLIGVGIDPKHETPRLNIDVENDGELFIKPRLNFKIYDAKGKLVKNVSGIEQKLLPNTSTRYVVEVADLSPQAYTGLLILRDGDRYFGERVKFEVPQ